MDRFTQLCTEWKQYKRIEEEAKKELDRIKGELIALMCGADTLSDGTYKVINKEITNNRFDSKAFKIDYECLYNDYCKQISSTRFIVN